MKKSVLLFSRIYSLLIAGLLVLCLSSCAGLLQRTGSVTFTFDAKVLQNAARDGGDPMTEEKGYRIEVALEGEGGFGVKQTVNIPIDVFEESMQTDRRFEASFDNIPVGKKMYALVKVYRGTPNNDVKEPFLIGKSNIFQVKAGNNSVELKAYQYIYNFLFNFEIKLDGFTNEEIKEGPSALLNRNLQFKVSYSNSKTAKKINSLGNDRFAIYDFIDEYTTAEYHEEIWDFYPDSDWEFNPDTKTISKKLELPIPIDENTNGTKGKEIVFFAYNVSPMAFGVSKKIQPVKGEEIETDVSFTVKKTLVSQVLYDYENDAYNYYINGQLNENLRGLTRGFCFDNDGYFYSFAKGTSNDYDTYELRSDNTGVNGITLPASGDIFDKDHYHMFSEETPVVMTTDKTTNELYANFQKVDEVENNEDTSIELFKFPSLISSGETSDAMFFRISVGKLSVDGRKFIRGNPFIVNNGILYIPISAPAKNIISLAFIDLNNPTQEWGIDYPTYWTAESDDIPVVDIVTDNNFINPIISDMYLANDVIYFLIKDSNVDYSDNATYNDSIVSRGAIIKHDFLTGKTFSLGWSNDNLTNNKMNNVGMYVTYENYFFYTEQSTVNPPYVLPVTGKVSYMEEIDNNTQQKTSDARNFFPSLYMPGAENLSEELSKTAFYGPDKIIGILPKKLVITDDGIAVFVDANNALNYKNVNRTIYIDLERFAFKEDDVYEEGYTFFKDNIYDIKDWKQFDAGLWTANNISASMWYLIPASDFRVGYIAGSLYLSIINKD